MAKVVICVDDDNATYYLLENAFQHLGLDFRLYRAKDGVAALLFLHSWGPFVDAPKPDLILMDLNMPRKDGLAVLAERCAVTIHCGNH